MLKALKSQLILLAEEKAGEFENAIRFRVLPERAESTITSLRNFILTMPELITQIRAWANDPRVPKSDRELHGYLLTYLYHPVDFISDTDNGLFGYLDDAYLVGRIYTVSMSHLDYGTRSSLPNMKGFETDVPQWLDMTRHVIPDEAVKIDRLIHEIKNGNLEGFSQALLK